MRKTCAEMEIRMEQLQGEQIGRLPRRADGLFEIQQLDENVFKAAGYVYPAYAAFETEYNKKAGYPDILAQLQILRRELEDRDSFENEVLFLKALLGTIDNISPQVYEYYRGLTDMFKQVWGGKYERRRAEEKAAEGKRAAGALSLVCKTARSAVIEIADGGKYFTKKPYRVTVNGIEEPVTERTITSLYGLRPDTDYLVEILDGEEKCGELFFHTDYEFVTLDVRRFGAKGDGIHGEGAFSGAARAD